MDGYLAVGDFTKSEDMGSPEASWSRQMCDGITTLALEMEHAATFALRFAT